MTPAARIARGRTGPPGLSAASTSRRRAGPRRSEAGAFATYERTLTGILAGSAVRAARVRAGISQADLATRTGTSQPAIARLEQGRVSPTIITLERIARALDSELVIDFEPVSAGAPHAARHRHTR